ncbi:hypothetical protein GON04_12985 [Ramlibacter sp. MAH-25]|uniref:Sodium:proline symporter n=2 Tax=Comamonadaceae TaxID=80864 RepID=A0A6N8ITW4_9BURK|nr:hypothetical protein [Ramlibacter sp. CGMCC 1.13660]MVQ30371.1 hypothetical protein [Ramlibacter pinisoli]
MGSGTWKWRAMDWPAAAVSGFAAGAVLMVLDLVWSALFNPDGPWRTSHMIAPILTGADQPSSYEFRLGVVATSLGIHYLLGTVFGMVMAALLVQAKLDSTPGRAMLAGALMGFALYLINFHLLVALFPWLTALRGIDTLAAHAVFGVAAAYLYTRLKRTAGE